MADAPRYTQPGVFDAPDFFPYDRYVVAPGRWDDAARYQRRMERTVRFSRVTTWVLGVMTGLAFATWFFVASVLTSDAEEMIVGTYATAGILLVALTFTAMVDFGVRAVVDDKAAKHVRSRRDLFRDASEMERYNRTANLTEQQLWDVALDIINLENARKVADWQRESIPTRNLTRHAQADRQALYRALQRRAAAIAETLDPTPVSVTRSKGKN